MDSGRDRDRDRGRDRQGARRGDAFQGEQGQAISIPESPWRFPPLARLRASEPHRTAGLSVPSRSDPETMPLRKGGRAGAKRRGRFALCALRFALCALRFAL